MFIFFILHSSENYLKFNYHFKSIIISNMCMIRSGSPVNHTPFIIVWHVFCSGDNFKDNVNLCHCSELYGFFKVVDTT